MKISSLVIATLFFSAVMTKDKLLSKTHTDKTGETSNFQGGRQADAVAWGYAHNDGYVLANNAVSYFII